MVGLPSMSGSVRASARRTRKRMSVRTWMLWMKLRRSRSWSEARHQDEPNPAAFPCSTVTSSLLEAFLHVGSGCKGRLRIQVIPAILPES